MAKNISPLRKEIMDGVESDNAEFSLVEFNRGIGLERAFPEDLFTRLQNLVGDINVDLEKPLPIDDENS